MSKAYTLGYSAAEIIKTFELQGKADFKPRYNLRPTQLLPVIMQGEEKGLSFFYWGTTPAFAKSKALAEKLYNIRAESIATSGLHLKALVSRKCLIPADGFYAWRQISKKSLVPYRYFSGDNTLVAFAGLWEEFDDSDGTTVHIFRIITTTANNLVGHTESRMPVIFDVKEALKWLDNDTEEAMAMLRPFPEDEMNGFAVSPRVNNPENDDAELIQPAPPADQFGNYSLFD